MQKTEEFLKKDDIFTNGSLHGRLIKTEHVLGYKEYLNFQKVITQGSDSLII